MSGTAAEGSRGIAIFLGNADAPQNYRGNDYRFRQESSFLYFWGIDEPGYAAILDLDSGQETVYDWSQIQRTVTTPKTIGIYYGKDLAFIIPKEAFGTHFVPIMQMVVQHIGLNNVRLTQ